MSTAKHTPGPWTVERHGGIHAPSGCIGELWGWMPRSEDKANRSLIAAAPEMLAALKSAKDGIEETIHELDVHGLECSAQDLRNVLTVVNTAIKIAEGSAE